MESPAEIKWTGYSLAERDWRWQRVRENAAKAGFDCILVPLCVDGRNLHLSLEQARGTRSDCRFLTCLDNAAVILPSDGREPIIVSDQESGNDWVPEPRPVEKSPVWSARALASQAFAAAFTPTGGHFTESSITAPTLKCCAVCPTRDSRTPRK